MIPLIRREISERREWLSPGDFADVLAIVQSAPGAIAVNTAAFVGWRLGGFPGLVLAVLGATLPSLLTILIVAAVFLTFQQNEFVNAVFAGLRPAVFALIVSAVFTVGRDVLGRRAPAGEANGPAAGEANRSTAARESSRADRRFGVAEIVIGVLLLTLVRLHPILVILLAGAAGIVRGRVIAARGLRARTRSPAGPIGTTHEE